MFIPIRTDYRLSRTPWVNYALIASNVLVYVLGYHGGSDKAMPYLLWPHQPELRQFFTCVFLHGDIMHLAGNMVFLWVFGNAVNDRLGNTGYLGFYLAGGVLAGVGYVLLSGNNPVLGASGAISAVTGAYLVLLPRARVTMLLWFYYITTFEISSLYFLLFQFVFNLFMSLVYQGGGGGVAYVAHSSGYVFGIVVAAGCLAAGLLPRDSFDLLNLLRTYRRRAQYRRIVSQGYDPFNYVSSRIRRGEDQPRHVQATGQSQPSDSAAGKELTLRREIAASLSRHDLAWAAQAYLQLVQIADDAVLPLNQQLDVANQLMAQERYPAAADAYERLVKHCPTYEYLPDIFLMLGILYGRYLHQADRARQYLTRAIERLKDPRKLEMAQADLRALGPR